jgi:hypothetical protein
MNQINAMASFVRAVKARRTIPAMGRTALDSGNVPRLTCLRNLYGMVSTEISAEISAEISVIAYTTAGIAATDRIVLGAQLGKASKYPKE